MNGNDNGINENVELIKIIFLLKWVLTQMKKEVYIKYFEKILYKKFLMYSGINFDNQKYMHRFEYECSRGKRVDNFGYNDFYRNISVLLKSFDILKLLNGEKDYQREP